MQTKTKNYIVLAILISILIAPSFVLAAWWNPFTWNWNFFNWFSKPVVVQPIQNINQADSYSFKSIKQWDPATQQHPNYSVEIYKNQSLVKTVYVKDTQNEPKLFTVSPDQKYVAFWIAGGGGTCVYFEWPTVIDLNNFSIVELDSSDIDKKLSSILGIDTKNGVLKFSISWQFLKTIKWISNNQIETSMVFGDKSSGGCPISWVGKPANAPTEVDANVIFTITN